MYWVWNISNLIVYIPVHIMMPFFGQNVAIVYARISSKKCFITYMYTVDSIWFSFSLLQVIDITEIRYIKDLGMLRNLNLLRNPIQELPDYRLCILFRIQSLVELDRHRVEVEEKVKTKTNENKITRCDWIWFRIKN